MAKVTNAPRSDAPRDRAAKRRARKLERRLSAVRALEEKRGRQAAKATDRGASPDKVARRLRQLEKARHRAAAIEAEIASLASGAPVETTAAGDGPQGYCLRDRRRVTIVNPAPMIMRNGRSAMAGTCPRCGARVVRP